MCRKPLLTIAILFLALIANTQNITGKIATKDGSPAAHVNIEVKELKKFTISDDNGFFTINNIKPGTYHMIISFAGLRTQQQELAVQKDKTT